MFLFDEIIYLLKLNNMIMALGKVGKWFVSIDVLGRSYLMKLIAQSQYNCIVD